MTFIRRIGWGDSHEEQARDEAYRHAAANLTVVHIVDVAETEQDIERGQAEGQVDAYSCWTYIADDAGLEELREKCVGVTPFDAIGLSMSEWGTPTLVRKLLEIKTADARGEVTTEARHALLGRVVTELRDRGVLD